MTDRTPWRLMLAAALQLGIAPRSFWRLSLIEWRALIVPPPAEALSRAAFETLALRFPDKTT